MKTAYLVKAVFLDGPHKGLTFFCGKGGHIADPAKVLAGQCYDTITSARIIVTRWLLDNKKQCSRSPHYRRIDYSVHPVQFV